MNALRFVRTLPAAVARSTSVFLRDVGRGLLEVSHNSLALIGLVVVAVAIFAATRVELRDAFRQIADDEVDLVANFLRRDCATTTSSWPTSTVRTSR